MDASGFLLDLLIILVVARFMGECSRMVGIPPMMGELCAGVLVGPSLLGLVEMN